MKVHLFSNLRQDIPASIVVFFVALPLCLGIALASGAPLFSGLIAGIVGGIVVGSISGSAFGVSGPAAGLTVIVLSAITSLGGFENFLVAVVLAGIIQIILGILKAGVIGYFFPNSVIKGMLTGIGIIIIIKEIPDFFGVDKTLDYGFTDFFGLISPGATVVGLSSLGILLLWDLYLTKKSKMFNIISGPLVAVAFGILYQVLVPENHSLAIDLKQLVKVPVPDSFNDFTKQFSTPNFAVIGNTQVWISAITIAVVASLETLLCVEATDKLDPKKRVTPTNKELVAQGAGNVVSGLIGGLPVTQVIVRSSANLQSGGQSKLSAIVHGFLLLISVVTIPVWLNKIPLAVLASILFIVGYKLAKPALFIKMFKLGKKPFIPFITTVVGIVLTDLLIGISMGMAVAIVIILKKSYENSHFLHKETIDENKEKVKMTLAEEVTFFNKGAILKEFDKLNEGSYLELDVTKTRFLDSDIIEIFDDFKQKAEEKNIHIKLISEKGTIENPKNYLEFFKLRK